MLQSIQNQLSSQIEQKEYPSNQIRLVLHKFNNYTNLKQFEMQSFRVIKTRVSSAHQKYVEPPQAAKFGMHRKNIRSEQLDNILNPHTQTIKQINEKKLKLNLLTMKHGPHDSLGTTRNRDITSQLFNSGEFDYVFRSPRTNIQSPITGLSSGFSTMRSFVKMPATTRAKGYIDQQLQSYFPAAKKEKKQIQQKTVPSSQLMDLESYLHAPLHDQTAEARIKSQKGPKKNQVLWLEVDNFETKKLSKVITKINTLIKPDLAALYQKLGKINQTKYEFESSKLSEKIKQTDTQPIKRIYKISFLQLIQAVSYYNFHVRTEGSRRLPKLISKHFIQILIFSKLKTQPHLNYNTDQPSIIYNTPASDLTKNQQQHLNPPASDLTKNQQYLNTPASDLTKNQQHLNTPASDLTKNQQHLNSLPLPDSLKTRSKSSKRGTSRVISRSSVSPIGIISKDSQVKSLVNFSEPVLISIRRVQAAVASGLLKATSKKDTTKKKQSKLLQRININQTPKNSHYEKQNVKLFFQPENKQNSCLLYSISPMERNFYRKEGNHKAMSKEQSIALERKEYMIAQLFPSDIRYTTMGGAFIEGEKVVEDDLDQDQTLQKSSFMPKIRDIVQVDVPISKARSQQIQQTFRRVIKKVIYLLKFITKKHKIVKTIKVASQYITIIFYQKTIKIYIHSRRQLIKLKINNDHQYFENLIMKMQTQHNIVKAFVFKEIFKRLKVNSKQFCGKLQVSKTLNGNSLSNMTLQKHLKLPIPSLLKLKTMILNNHIQLSLYFNILTYILVHKKLHVGSYVAYATLYFSFDRRKEENIRTILNSDTAREKLYFFDGEHLFLSLVINNMNSKIQSCRLAFSQLDLEQLFSIRIGEKFYNGYQTFTDKQVISCIYKILSNTHSEKKFLYLQPAYLKLQIKRELLRGIDRNGTVRFNHKSNAMKSSGIKAVKVGNLKVLERQTNGAFIILYEEKKDAINKQFFDTSVQDTRVIGHFVRQVALQYDSYSGNIFAVNRKQKDKQDNITEYAIITIMCNLIIDGWICTIYVPKTSRRLVGWINILDLAELKNSSTLFKSLRLKTEYITDFHQFESRLSQQTNIQTYQIIEAVQNVKITQFREHKKLKSLVMKVQNDQSLINQAIKKEKELLFKNLVNFFQLTRDISNKMNTTLMNRSLFQKKQYCHQMIEFKIWETLLKDGFKVGLKPSMNPRLESEYQNLKYNEKILIDQIETDSLQEPDTGATIVIIGQKYQIKQKNQTQENGDLLTFFKHKSNQYRKFLDQNDIVMIRSDYSSSSSQFCIQIGRKTNNLKEFLHNTTVKLDKLGITRIDFYLEAALEEPIASKYSRNMRRASVRYSATNRLPNSFDNIFLPFEAINYAHCSSYNLLLKIFCFHQQQPVVFKTLLLNIREVLNLYIADGFFKYQTNFMNAKLTLSDLKQICEYIGFKIKTQNYLGLASQQEILQTKPHQIFLQEHKEVEDGLITDGFVYSCVKKRKKYFKVIQIQLFLKRQKIHVNTYSKMGEFIQKKMNFDQCDNIYSYFSIMVKGGLYMSAMQRLAVFI